MYVLFSWFCFLQTALLFTAYAQGNSKETSKPPTVEHQALREKQNSTEKIHYLKDRFISHDEKPAIFGSHAYNPITQEFEVVTGFNETLAHIMNDSQHHSYHVNLTTKEAPGSARARLGRFRNKKPYEIKPELRSLNFTNMPMLALRTGPELNEILNKV